MAVKKKLKIKKKNFTIFVLLICIIVYLIVTSFNFVTDKLTKNHQSSNNEVVKAEKEKNTEEKKKTLTDEEKKLKELNNIDKKIDYFNKKYIDRYLKYKENNPDMDLEKIIIYVNMGLDNNYYTNTIKTPYLNKEYILVNKYNYLTDDYIPDNLESISTKYALNGMKLVKVAKEAFENMAKDALNNKMSIIAMSSYRSYSYQVNLYNKYVKADGKEAADTYSGRPGHSEHQTGLAVDVYNGKENYTNFEKTKEFNWMQDNAYKYGFILRFPKNKTNETGYMYESWHYRYVGVEIAKYIYEKKISFEEYYVRFIENKK
ncbi:MAG: M15 family metallopeptidase [Bacilli bacterium]|nr:M15 family metallopeptidase [Bacilli bacterium]